MFFKEISAVVVAVIVAAVVVIGVLVVVKKIRLVNESGHQW